MNMKVLLLATLLTTCILQIKTCGLPTNVRPEIAEVERKQGNQIITEEHLKRREMSQISGTYRKMKIFMDMTPLNTYLDTNKMGDKVKTFYKKVFDIAAKWWESVLLVNDNKSQIAATIESIRETWDADEAKNVTFQMGDKKMGDYDMYIKIKFDSKSNGEGLLAHAEPIERHPDSQRPICGLTAITSFGHKMVLDKGLWYAVDIMIHEMGHIFAFHELSKYHSKYVSFSKAMKTFVWKSPKALAYARIYYKCETVEGVPLQVLNGEAGDHWSEPYLNGELMSPSMEGVQTNIASVFTFALLEDTKWYKVDYSYAENFEWLKGSGCNLTKDCPNPPPCKAESSGFIMSNKQGVGYCEKDERTNCPVERMDRSCNDSSHWDEDLTEEGATYGGNCAVVYTTFTWPEEGDEVTRDSWNISAQVACDSSAKTYTVTYRGMKYDDEGEKTGKDAVVTCDKAGIKKWNTEWGYPSETTCEDPATFCSSRFPQVISKNKVLCDQSCTENGRCINTKQTPAFFKKSISPRFLFLKRSLAELGLDIVEKAQDEEQWKCWCYANYEKTDGKCPAV